MKKILVLAAAIIAVGSGLTFGIHSAQALTRQMTFGQLKAACLPDAGCDFSGIPASNGNTNTNTNNNTNSGGNKNNG